MKYSIHDIKVNKSPNLKELANQKREQTWDIVLKKAIPKKIKLEDISQKLSQKDFDVKVEVKKEKYLTVCVTTLRNLNPYGHDYSVFEIYKMFDKIEQLLGSIDTIQGQKIEDRWSPFKKKEDN